MPTNIPPGREHLWRRQAEADAEVKRTERALDNADDTEVAQRLIEHIRAQAVAERVYQERTKGLSSWIDESPYLPVCPDCKGSGGPVAGDAHDACPTCRGWGREDDGTPAPPVWHDADEHGSAGWFDPVTGRQVDAPADVQAEQDHAFHNPHTPPGWVSYGPDGVTPVGKYKTVDNGDGTTTMHLMTLFGWRELPETTANNGRKPAQPPKSPPAQPPSQNPGTPSGGTTMASIEEVRVAILCAVDKAQESVGALQQAHGDLEQAQSLLMQAVEGSGQNDQQEALGLFQQAIGSIEEVQQSIQAASQAAEGVAGRL